MASVRKYKTKDGVRWLGLVRVTGWKPATKGEFLTRAEALAWGTEYQADLKAQKVGGTRPTLTQTRIAKLIEDFIADPEESSGKAFFETKRLLQWWTANAGHVPVMEFGVVTIRECRKKLEDQTLKNGKHRTPATVNRYLSAMRTAWNWARNAGCAPPDRAWPSKNIMRTEPKGRVRFLSDAELDALLEAATPDPTMRAMILVSVATGLRQAELMGLTWADIVMDDERPRVVVRDSKNGGTNSVHLPASAVAAIKALKKDRIAPQTQHVFLNSEGAHFRKESLLKRWYVIRAAAKLDDFRWHDLRHTTASYLGQNGATLSEIGKVLRHRSPSATHRYVHHVEGASVRGHDALDAKLTKSATQSA